ncbi:glucose-6-phosphate 1-dehydrogenase [Pyrus ussuriensis x Pyrus communis]|uniref:Glucose-6-phosphate 1-dehydrogenase n=1 Tax=Pyrus ussuriensis x Pyrus communis TaxID=2448454 RepID=A0A5N5F7S8_9ROSA|nr:glucose-6-phosphate 1-dehydrogenase [Pyrus ussuriensis x Pyrus communis]
MAVLIGWDCPTCVRTLRKRIWLFQLEFRTTVRHHLICHFWNVLPMRNKELECLYELGGFIWLSNTLRGWFQLESDQLFNYDRPSLRVQKCGLHLVYLRDEEEFKQTIMLWMTSLREAGSTTGTATTERIERPNDTKGMYDGPDNVSNCLSTSLHFVNSGLFSIDKFGRRVFDSDIPFV